MCQYCDWIKKSIEEVEDPILHFSKMDIKFNGIRVGVIETGIDVVDGTPVLATDIYAADNVVESDRIEGVTKPIKYCPMCGEKIEVAKEEES